MDGDRHVAKQGKCLIVLYSYHHHNTEKIAGVLAQVLAGQIKTPGQIRPEELLEYDLIGFGSGIYGAKHHPDLLNLANRLPKANDQKVFIFSTNAILGETKVAKDHLILREKLHEKGYQIVGEFSCKGFNTNSFLKYFGGMNKGRPNEVDLNHAHEFALNLKQGYITGNLFV